MIDMQAKLRSLEKFLVASRGGSSIHWKCCTGAIREAWIERDIGTFRRVNWV